MMPVLRKAPEKLFTKVIISKGYGFHTPQDGSVCKIKVIFDEANLISGLNDEQTKEIIIGDVDEHVDQIIEDCVRTMKEEEICYIQFQHPDAATGVIIPVDNSDDTKNATNAVNHSETEMSKADSSISDNGTVNDKSNLQSEVMSNIQNEQENTENNTSQNSVSSSNSVSGGLSNEVEATLNIKSEQVNSETCTSQNSVSGSNSVSDGLNNAEVNESSVCSKGTSFNVVKVQLQLLSYTREPEIWEMSITEKWRRATYHKQRGLELYARGIYQYAFRRFGLTLKYVISLEHDVPYGQEEGMDIKGLKLSCYLNVAACQMRHHNFESVVINSTKALNLQPNNAKALYRRGAAYLQLQEYEKAKEDLMAAQQLEPKNQAVAKQLQVLKSSVLKLNQYYTSAMKNMFS